jgi:hypothetical protein
MPRFWICDLGALAGFLFAGPVLAAGPTLMDGKNTPLKPFVAALSFTRSRSIAEDRARRSGCHPLLRLVR